MPEGRLLFFRATRDILESHDFVTEFTYSGTVENSVVVVGVSEVRGKKWQDHQDVTSAEQFSDCQNLRTVHISRVYSHRMIG